MLPCLEDDSRNGGFRSSEPDLCHQPPTTGAGRHPPGVHSLSRANSHLPREKCGNGFGSQVWSPPARLTERPCLCPGSRFLGEQLHPTQSSSWAQPCPLKQKKKSSGEKKDQLWVHSRLVSRWALATLVGHLPRELLVLLDLSVASDTIVQLSVWNVLLGGGPSDVLFCSDSIPPSRKVPEGCAGAGTAPAAQHCGICFMASFRGQFCPHVISRSQTERG